METFAELGRVEAVRKLFEGSGYEAFGEPLWFESKEHECITTASKSMLEGVDFDLVYFPLKHLGYKAVIAVTGELYAVLASPRTLSVSLGVSAKLDYAQIQQLWSGIVAAAREHGYKSLSLDLQPSRNGLTISLCATGSHPWGIERPKAQSKDLICISGSLGAAYLGMRLLELGKQGFEKGESMKQETLEQHKMLIGAYLKPELGVDVPKVIGDAGITPTMGYFITRGLSDTLLRLTRDSGLGAKVYAEKIPFEGGSFDLGRELDIDPVSAAMNGGEDCKLLFTIPISQLETFRKDFQAFDIIGHLALPEVGAVLVTPEGVELPVTAQGWKTDNQF